MLKKEWGCSCHNPSTRHIEWNSRFNTKNMLKTQRICLKQIKGGIYSHWSEIKLHKWFWMPKLQMCSKKTSTNSQRKVISPSLTQKCYCTCFWKVVRFSEITITGVFLSLFYTFFRHWLWPVRGRIQGHIDLVKQGGQCGPSKTKEYICN